MDTNLNKLKEAAKPEYFFWGALVLALVFLVQEGSAPSAAPAAVTASVAASDQSEAPDPFSKIELAAKAATVYDVNGKRFLFEQSADTVLPLASITKVMTAMTALSLVPEGTLISINDEALHQEGDSGLYLHEIWPLKDLLRLLLLESSNDAAYAVSATVGSIGAGVEQPEYGRGFFIARMNEQAAKLSMKSTYFLNESGLDLSPTQPGAVSTAKETALMFSKAILSHRELFETTRWSELLLQSDNGPEHTATNTNKGTDKFPLLLASKTGFTDLAGGNLVIAFDAGFNYPIVVVVLGSTPSERFSDAEKLVWATLQHLADSK